MATFSNPTFTSDYQGLCNKVADVLNRQDLLTAIPDFTVLATSRIQRDMARIKHPFAVIRALAPVVQNYVPLPADFVSVYQLLETDTTAQLEYVSPDQSKEVMSRGWDNTAVRPSATATARNPTYYTLLGTRIRIFPPPGSETPLELDLWYYARIPALRTQTPTNWVLTRYPDLYLYGTLVHSAPYLKADERIQVWEGAYQSILDDIAVEAERAVRPQTKLVAARKSF